jgi:hypothetical protein
MSSKVKPRAPLRPARAAEGGAKAEEGVGQTGNRPPQPFKELPLAQARSQFRALTLVNPNFFGTLKESEFAPVQPIQLNTHYEELKCVGFNPQFDRLEAVVHVKQETGYGGGVCSAGTPEYVRFYLSTDGGLTWVDQGLARFQSYDIPGVKPLEYAATVWIHPDKLYCTTENLVRVRAILSWNDPPDGPDFTPVWGNVLEAQIQIGKAQFLVLADAVKLIDAALVPKLAKIVDLAQPVAGGPGQPVKPADLAKKYKGKEVPGHRFLFKELKKRLAKPVHGTAMSAALASGYWPQVEVNLAEVVEALLQTDGDTGFEELKCVGLNPNNDTLVATLQLKRASGYSGDLCSPGSLEYVAFWEYDEIEATWLHLGTASVNVYDIASIPAEGLQYSVFLPADLRQHHRPCAEGARVIRIRAILSWEEAPPDDKPDWVPTWGNREETRVHVSPGTAAEVDDHSPYIETVASMSVADIDANGIADGLSAGTAYFEAVDSPFGGVIRITGRLLNPTDSFLGLEDPLRYKVSVRRSGVGEVWKPLTNSFDVYMATLQGGLYTGPFKQKQEVVDQVWYKYLEDYSGVDKRFYTIPILAEWHTGGETGLWEIRIDAYDPNDGTDWPGSQVIRVWLDQAAPEVALAIIGYIRGAAPMQPAAACGKFQVGDIIVGTYSAIDVANHFYRFSLYVAPGGPGWPSFGAAPVPSERVYPVADTHGENGGWQLDTSGMAPCGYTLHLWAEDRTIVSGGGIGWEASTSVGFCLEAAP